MTTRSICTVVGAVAVTAALPLTGCTSAAEPDEPESAVRTQPLGTEKTAIEAPAELKIKTRTLVRVGKARTTTAATVAPPVVDESQVFASQPDRLTREELAEALRPITLVGDYEYTLPEPDYELADKILRGDAWPTVAESQGRDGRACCGIDERIRKRHNTSNPYRYLLFSQHGCSGALISNRTAITAAHCVYQTENDIWWTTNCGDGHGVHLNWWAKGVDGLDANPRPYGWQDCIVFTIPAAYANASSQADGARWDFAILDFYAGGCGQEPGTTGHFGSGTVPADEVDQSEVGMFGYPGKTNIGNSIEQIDDIGGPGTYRYTDAPWGYDTCVVAGQIWGMLGDVGETYVFNPPNGFMIITTGIDGSKGASGSGAYIRKDDGNWYIVGHYIASSDDPHYNMIRRFEDEVAGFFWYYSNWPD